MDFTLSFFICVIHLRRWETCNPACGLCARICIWAFKSEPSLEPFHRRAFSSEDASRAPSNRVGALSHPSAVYPLAGISHEKPCFSWESRFENWFGTFPWKCESTRIGSKSAPSRSQVSQFHVGSKEASGPEVRFDPKSVSQVDSEWVPSGPIMMWLKAWKFEIWIF